MQRLLPSCMAAPRYNAALTNSTSLYETHLGLVSLAWSPALFGLSVSADFRLSGGVTAPQSTTSSFIKHDSEDEDDEDEQKKSSSSFRFRFRPWFLWKRRGSRKFRIKYGNNAESGDREVEFFWDLSHAKFSPYGGSEPISGFYVAIIADREMLMVAGDLHEMAYKKTKMMKNPEAALISRRENVEMRCPYYRTVVKFGDTKREIFIVLSREKGMAVEIDGEKLLRIRRLGWKFRGCEKVQTEDGKSVQISWDLHDWLFGPYGTLGPKEEKANAKFVFKFEKPMGPDWYLGWGPFEKISNWSSGSDKWRKKSFSSATSSMTSSSFSTSSSVMEWTSSEEVEMRRGEAFSFLVYLSR